MLDKLAGSRDNLDRNGDDRSRCCPSVTGDILKDWRRMSEICRCVNAVCVLPCPIEVMGVEAGVTIGYNAEVVQSSSGVVHKVMMCVGACTNWTTNSFFVQFCVKACRKFLILVGIY